MAEALAKRKRITELSNFTRNRKNLIKLFDDAAPANLVNPQYEKMRDCYDRLEIAHNEFLAVTEIDDIETHKEGIPYMDGPDKRYEEAMTRYVTYIKTDTQQEMTFQQDRAKTDRAIEKEAREELARDARTAEENNRKADLKRQFDT